MENIKSQTSFSFPFSIRSWIPRAGNKTEMEQSKIKRNVYKEKEKMKKQRRKEKD